MPKLIRLYILNVAIGFALSAVFLGLLVWLNIGGLRHLLLETSSGAVAAVMLFVMNGIIFAGAQFAIAIMQLAEVDAPPRGGLRAGLHTPNLAKAKAAAKVQVVAGPQRP